MNIITCDDWQEQTIGDSEYQFAQTSDPRVLTVIQYDRYAQIDELYDGDAINPIIYVDHSHGLRFSHVAGYDGGEAEKMQAAYDRWGWDGTARRYLWIFHGIAAENANGGYDRSGNWIVATSNEFVQHIEAEAHSDYETARQECEAMAKDLEQALDGYVYGIGHATLEERRMHDDEDIDLTDWDIDMTCWGFVGEEYARSEAAINAGYEVELPEMLEVLA